jgi:hypothetical protein
MNIHKGHAKWRLLKFRFFFIFIYAVYRAMDPDMRDMGKSNGSKKKKDNDVLGIVGRFSVRYACCDPKQGHLCCQHF